jgi:hypothetical protein
MKILAQTVGNELSGFEAAAKHAGHEWIWWQEEHTPAFDVFDEVRPEVVFMSGDPSAALHSCLAEFKPKHVLTHPDTPFEFKLQGTNGLAFKPGLVDLHTFHAGKPTPAYLTTLCAVCPPNPVILGYCEDLGRCIKIIHEEPWPVAQYLGVGSLDDKRQLYQSAGFSFVSTYMEALRAVSCGSIVISDTLEDLGLPLMKTTHGLLSFMDEVMKHSQMASTRDNQQRLLADQINTYDIALTHIMERLL